VPLRSSTLRRGSRGRILSVRLFKIFPIFRICLSLSTISYLVSLDFLPSFAPPLSPWRTLLTPPPPTCAVAEFKTLMANKLSESEGKS